MKKLALATAIAAASTLSSGAHALISSNITGVQLISGGSDITMPCAYAYNPGFTTGLLLTGTVPFPTFLRIASINLTGQVCLDHGIGIPVALNFALSGTATANGTTFDHGSIAVFLDYGSGWIFAYNVDAAATTVDCTTTAGTGLRWTATPGTNTLPGGATPAPPGTPTNGVCTLFGYSTTIFLSGSNSW